MAEPDGPGVEGLTLQDGVRFPIQRISQKRMPFVGEMDPDLVGTSGEEMDPEHRILLPFCQDFIVRHRRPAVGTHGPPIHTFFRPSDRVSRYSR